MTMHLQKLSVGSESIDTLRDWQKTVMRRRERQGMAALPDHVTRMFPKQKDALLDGGSIYWVIKGLIQCRNTIVGLEECRNTSGQKACRIVLDPKLVPVVPAPRRAFQGWRYLKPEDIPVDLTGRDGLQDLPANLRNKLVDLGAW